MQRCRRRFLEYFPDGFRDTAYVDTERSYKWEAHRRWRDEIGTLDGLEQLSDRECVEVARRAVRIEASTNLLFSFEKMAVRDALSGPDGARQFVVGLMQWLYYGSKLSWDTYASLLGFAQQVRRDVRDLRPRDMIDIQSFIWVQGSDEYE
ncbi:MAG TPA: hypothetical protein VGI86_10565 [Acidimicrobiia bacterium]